MARSSGLPVLSSSGKLPLDEDGAPFGGAVGGAHDELGLEDPGLILEFLGLVLGVDQEQRDRPGGVAAAADAAHVDLGTIWNGIPGA